VSGRRNEPSISPPSLSPELTLTLRRSSTSNTAPSPTPLTISYLRRIGSESEIRHRYIGNWLYCPWNRTRKKIPAPKGVWRRGRRRGVGVRHDPDRREPSGIERSWRKGRWVEDRHWIRHRHQPGPKVVWSSSNCCPSISTRRDPSRWTRNRHGDDRERPTKRRLSRNGSRMCPRTARIDGTTGRLWLNRPLIELHESSLRWEV